MRRFITRSVFLLLCLASVSSCGKVGDPWTLRQEKSFEQAADAYKKGEFSKAIDLYQEILSQASPTAEVLYNLGNAYLKDRKVSQAVVCYLRAEALSPRDADLKANLAFARSSVQGYQPLGLPQGAGIFPLIKTLSADELKWIAFFLFIAATMVPLLGVYCGMKQRRNIQLSIVLGVLCVYCIAAGFVKAVHEASLAVVLHGQDVKFEPSSEATTYFKVSEGQEVRFLRQSDKWIKIERPDGKMGWVAADALEKVRN